jgi:hypothetical protein
MAKQPDFTPDRPLTPEQLAELRERLSKMSLTDVRDYYHAAWLRCGLERNGSRPKAEWLQQLVQAWRAMGRT